MLRVGVGLGRFLPHWLTLGKFVEYAVLLMLCLQVRVFECSSVFWGQSY